MISQLEKIYLKQLYNIDSHLKEHNIKCLTKDRATNPFLLTIPDNYEEFQNRVMIFGQETNGWCRECGNKTVYSNSLKKSIEIYKRFYLNGGINKYRGAFWNEFKRVRDEVTKSKSVFFIWNNINKIGRVGKGNVAEIDKLQFSHFNVIKEEIRILKPEIFIFFTGPNYDHFIRKNIGDFKQKMINDSLYEVEFSGEFSNIKAFKTLHPNGLYLKGKNRIVIPNLINEIKKACN